MTTEHGDQLRDAFENHESLAPDPAAVFARVQELSVTYKRRRRALQAAGGTVLGAGLLAGALGLPSVLGSHGTAGTINAGDGPVPVASPSVDPSMPAADFNKGLAEYFKDGYGYNDAVKLAALWNTKADIAHVKAEAGLRLLRGEKLPVPPTGNADNATSAPVDPAIEKAYQAYFAAGYTWDEAVQLKKIWHLKDEDAAKIMGGKLLEQGKKLPVSPKPANVQSAKEDAAVNKFFTTGYTVDDAVQLAKLWHLKDAYAAKVMGGEKLLNGETLPIKP